MAQRRRLLEEDVSDFDQPPEDIVPRAVLPLRAGRESKTRGCHVLDLFCERLRRDASRVLQTVRMNKAMLDRERDRRCAV
jgi:hypothetical protein